ncbi:MAG: type II secretion system F family protein [bacterium]
MFPSFGGKKVKLKEKIVFANNLSAMIGAGLSLAKSINVMERQTNNKYFKSVIRDLGARVGKGESLSGSMSAYPKVFPALFISMVNAGEESGNLPGALKMVSEQLSKTYDLQRKIKGAMVYPAVIISVISVLGIVMMVYLVPVLTKTFQSMGVELPMSTQILIWLSSFMKEHLILVILAIVAAVVSLVAGIKTTRGQRIIDGLIMKIPVIADISKQSNAAMTMRTISSLITAGVSMIDTLKITERILQNHYFKDIMTEAKEEIQKGTALSVVVKRHEKVYPLLVGEMIEVGEETGDLPGMLLKGASFYEDEVDQTTKNLSSIIEPAIMVIIGIAVGFFAVSMLGPMYSLSGAIK